MTTSSSMQLCVKMIMFVPAYMKSKTTSLLHRKCKWG